jgi:glycosyltransferase involved in cell wall biosynthesis
MPRIAINAGIAPGKVGGTANFLLGLLRGLGKLEDGNEEYVVIGTPETTDLLYTYVSSNQKVVTLGDQRAITTPINRPNLRRRIVNRARWLARRLLFPPEPTTGTPMPSMRWIDIPVSDGFYESLNCDMIHFPYQGFTLCALPSIYQPWDLQHRHYPYFFDPMQIAWREVLFRAGCDYSNLIVVASQWIKQDIIYQYGTHPDKIHIVPVAPPTQAETISDVIVVEARYELPDRFVLYPAVTWPHKNHVRLLEAIALLRDIHDLRVNLVCTGAQTPEHFPKIQARIEELNLGSQVQFLNLVPANDLRAIYRLASFVVFPSLFEGAGMPPLEAWNEGKAVACSTATSLPEIVGDAALLFDPLSVEAIAQALRTLTIDEALCNSYERLGTARLSAFSWIQTAKIYRALYRKLTHSVLTEEDIYLLGAT